jgi:hypothetical protein
MEPECFGAIRGSSLTMRKRFGFFSEGGLPAFGSLRLGSMAEPPFDAGLRSSEKAPAGWQTRHRAESEQQPSSVSTGHNGFLGVALLD